MARMTCPPVSFSYKAILAHISPVGSLTNYCNLLQNYLQVAIDARTKSVLASEVPELQIILFYSLLLD